MKSINEKAEKAYCDFIEVKKDAIEQIKQSGFNEIVMNIQINRVMIYSIISLVEQYAELYK